MNQARVISINPGTKTAGELGGRCTARLARISRCITSPGRRTVSTFKRFVNLAFGLNRKVNAQLSGKLMFLRILGGTLMLLLVLAPMSPEMIFEFNLGADPLIICAFGVSMIFGFLSRPVSYASAAWFGWLLADSLATGSPDVTYALLLMIAVVFCMLGPGMFSADQLIRNMIFKIRMAAAKKRGARRMSGRLNYNAYTDLEKRLG